ncbi:MAG: hypothetical protein WEB79_00200, partial [Thermoleophilaceae bacterium]
TLHHSPKPTTRRPDQLASGELITGVELVAARCGGGGLDEARGVVTDGCGSDEGHQKGVSSDALRH